MHVRIRIEQFIALILGILGIAALFTVWFSRAILVFHLDEFAGGELDYLAESAFQLSSAQLGLLIVGALFLATAVVLMIAGAIRASHARQQRLASSTQ